MTYGKSPFTCSPHWEIDNAGLATQHGLDYLGTVLSKDNGKEHASSRIKSSNRAYFSLQGAGLCQSGLAPHTSAHVYQTAVRCGLLYGCSSIYMNKSGLLELDKTQGKYLKSMLGIGYNCHKPHCYKHWGSLHAQ